jgi:hypothetical protein
LRFKWLPITSFEDMTADLEQLQALNPLVASENLADVAAPATALANLSGVKGVTSPTMQLAAGGGTIVFSGSSTASATVTTGLGSFSNWVAHAMLIGTSGQYVFWSVGGNSTSVTFNASSSVSLSTSFLFQWLVLGW